jgi:two-component system response regulator PilR (NtrC family)
VSHRVLLLEDEPALRQVLERALKTFGYEVASSGDPSSAYLMLSETRFDAVVLDLRMPNMLGDAFYFAVVRHWPYLRGRVILMSGDAGSGTGDWPDELRDCPMLTKPFTLDVLAHTVATIVAPGGERRQTHG